MEPSSRIIAKITVNTESALLSSSEVYFLVPRHMRAEQAILKASPQRVAAPQLAVECTALNRRSDFDGSVERASSIGSFREEGNVGCAKQRQTMTTKNGVFWDVTPCGSCKNRLLH
jgi:hypothetical protein